mmetsp:Transcript_9987/g.20823  ORF Transcript_9987/g.20823 Transcript_9987/m.20823 type:complete len:265 (-) Transcript_9987:154-948(-)
MNENVRVIASLEWKGPTVDQRMALVQNHVPGFHGNVYGVAVSIIHLQRPWFVDVLGNIDNPAAHQGNTVDVWAQNRSLGILANSVQTHGPELGDAPRPFGNPVNGGIPNSVFEFRTRTLQIFFFHADHVRGRFPVVGINVSAPPLLKFFRVFVGLPKACQEFQERIGCLEFRISRAGHVDHRLGLANVHGQAILLLVQAVRLGIVIETTLHKIVVKLLALVQHTWITTIQGFAGNRKGTLRPVDFLLFRLCQRNDRKNECSKHE